MKIKLMLILSIVASVLIGCVPGNATVAVSDFNKDSIVINKAAEMLKISPEKLTKDNLLQITELRLTEADMKDAVSDYDLRIISEMKNIERLELLNLKVSNTEFLGSLGKLKTLTLYNCGIKELSNIKALSSLEILHVGKNQIQDVAPLADLSKLKSLYVAENPITDISMLSNLSNLERLVIKDTLISDISVALKLSSLNQLDIRDTKVKQVAPLREIDKHLELFLLKDDIEDLDTIKSNDNIIISEDFLG